jgi:hypothetical protein
MLRPVAAGWMCLGFVTLGVAAFAGQEEERKREGDVIAIEGEVREAAAGAVAPRSAEEAKLIDIKIGDDGRAAVAVDGETRRIEVREGGDVIILNGDDGRIVERIQAGPQPGLFSMRARFAGAPAIDPGRVLTAAAARLRGAPVAKAAMTASSAAMSIR